MNSGTGSPSACVRACAAGWSAARGSMLLGLFAAPVGCPCQAKNVCGHMLLMITKCWCSQTSAGKTRGAHRVDVGGEELVERQPLDAGVKVAVHGQDLRAAWATQRPWGVPGAERDLCQNDTLHARGTVA